MNTRKFTAHLIQQFGIHSDKQKEEEEAARRVNVLIEIKLVN
jgi:hypothetical protein